MTDAKTFCTCKDTSCPLHPIHHDQGCTLCIAKNLKTREIPNCYFDLLENCPPHTAYSLKAFADCVLACSSADNA